MNDEQGTALRWRHRLVVAIGHLGLRLLGASWRVRVHGRSALLTRPEAAPRVVLALWHGQMLPILWAHRQPTAVLISEHRDGELIARVVAAFGFSAVRGSTSRGGARALLRCVQAVQGGRDLAVTPDGPRGPRHSVAPGALVVAHRAGVPIVPIVMHADRRWRLQTWDGFEIPKPFARVTILYGEPRTFAGEDVRVVSQRTGELAAAMADDMARVAALSQLG